MSGLGSSSVCPAFLIRCIFVFDIYREHTFQLLSTELLCLSDPLPTAHQHRGALWGPERGHPGSLHLCFTEASVSSQYHSVTAPAGRSSSSKSQSRLSIHPPRAHTLEVRLGREAASANTGFWSDSLYFLAIYALVSFALGLLLLPKQGAGASWRECGGVL